MKILGLIIISMLLFGCGFDVQASQDNATQYTVSWSYADNGKACPDPKQCQTKVICKVGNETEKRVGFVSGDIKSVTVKRALNCNDEISCYIYGQNSDGDKTEQVKAKVVVAKGCGKLFNPTDLEIKYE